MCYPAIVAAVLGLVPAQNGQLSLANVRVLHDVLGIPRSETRFLPGDRCVIAFDIEGVRTDAAGKAAYSIALDVTDADGKLVFRQKPRDLDALSSLGGNRLPASATVDIGVQQPPGEYTVKVTVTDLAARTSKSIERQVRVLPKGFGLVRLTASIDPSGQYPAPVFVEGQSIWVNFAAVGFTRGSGKQPHLAVSLRVLDEDGKPTTPKPIQGEVTKDVPEKASAVPMQFLLALNRPGNFTVEIAATDKVGDKDGKLTFPLKVLKAK